MTNDAQASWQPIETAPKDGTDILVWPYWSDRQPAQVHWRDLKRTPGRWEITPSFFCAGAAPTHWKPLDAPPAPVPSTQRGMCHDHPMRRCSPDNCCSLPSASPPSPELPAGGREELIKQLSKDWARQIVNAGGDENVAQQAVALAALNGLFDHALPAPAPHAEVRKALEPFAAVARVMDFYTEESMPLMIFPRPECESHYPDEPRCVALTAQDFQRAAQALAPPSERGEVGTKK